MRISMPWLLLLALLWKYFEEPISYLTNIHDESWRPWPCSVSSLYTSWMLRWKAISRTLLWSKHCSKKIEAWVLFSRPRDIWSAEKPFSWQKYFGRVRTFLASRNICFWSWEIFCFWLGEILSISQLPVLAPSSKNADIDRGTDSSFGRSAKTFPTPFSIMTTF